MRPFLLFFFFLFSPLGYAADLTAPSLGSLMRQVEQASFSYRGHGLLFGHESVESCAYSAPGILVLDSYCFPEAAYPARAVQVWSRELGIVEFYEQDLGKGKVWRELRQNEFPELVQSMFSFSFESLDFDTINSAMAKFYERSDPGCWSTSFDFQTGEPSAGCYRADIGDFPLWKKESLDLVVDGNRWSEILQRILFRAKGGRAESSPQKL